MYKGTGHGPDSCTMCPSDTCWSYDDDSHTCTLIQSTDCSTLMCFHDFMAIAFSGAVFGINDDDQEDATWAGEVKPAYNTEVSGAWGVAVPLGEMGMTHKIVGDTIVFSVWVGLDGSQRKRSDINIKGVEIDMGHTMITTGFNGIAMKYECTYDRTITVSSETYAVEDVTVTDAYSGRGNLADGFSLILNNGDGLVYILGAELPVQVQWDITVLKDLRVEFDDCTVKHGNTDVPIIKDSCYATTVAARPLASTHNTKTFEYRVFKAKGETERSQIVECTVTVCDSTTCSKYDNASNDDCPQEDNDAHYKFTIDAQN